MKKRSVLMRIGVLAAAVTLATTSLMSGTLAKYTNDMKVTGTALVAKWDPKLSVGGKSTTGTSFNLVDTMEAAAKGKNMKATVIAPGTKGGIDVSLGNGTSEVDVEFQVQLKYKGGAAAVPDFLPQNLKWSLTGDGLSGAQEVAFDGDGVMLLATPIKIPATSTVTKAYTLHWEWPYEDTNDDDTQKLTRDAEDTLRGGNAQKSGSEAKIEYEIYVTATQVDPTATTPGP